jgi:hypothetical protein
VRIWALEGGWRIQPRVIDNYHSRCFIDVALDRVLLAPQPEVDWTEFRSLRQVSDHLVGFQIVNYFSRNADTMLIGRFLGTEPLGWYNMAYKLMLFPVQNLSTVIGRALLPVLSRTQKEPETLRGIYLNSYFHDRSGHFSRDDRLVGVARTFWCWRDSGTRMEGRARSFGVVGTRGPGSIRLSAR